MRASDRPRRRKSRRAVTRDILDRPLATCASDRLVDTRDIAILDGRVRFQRCPRNEVAQLRVEQLAG